MIAPADIDALDARLDRLTDEARRRHRQRLNVPRAGADELAAALAGIRRELRVWCARAAIDAPRASGERHA